MEAPLPAPTMRWLGDVLQAANTERRGRSMAAHAGRLGRTMINMIAGGIALRPTPPAYFAFVKGADGSWTPYMLGPDAEGAHKILASKWPQPIVSRLQAGLQAAHFDCGSAVAEQNIYINVDGVQALHFVKELGFFSSSASFASSLPGVEAGLVAWLRERGYRAEAASLRLKKATGWASIMRVSW